MFYEKHVFSEPNVQEGINSLLDDSERYATNFDEIEKLGRGGYGHVFKVINPGLAWLLSLSYRSRLDTWMNNARFVDGLPSSWSVKLHWYHGLNVFSISDCLCQHKND